MKTEARELCSILFIILQSLEAIMKNQKHFYVDLLGFKVIRENYRKERDDYKIDLACGPQEIGPHLGQTL